MGSISLQAAVAELRAQILAAKEDAEESEIAFEITEAVVEISGAFSNTKDANGKLKAKFNVFGFGAEGEAGGGLSYSQENAQKITLKLDVLNRNTGDKEQINDEDERM